MALTKKSQSYTMPELLEKLRHYCAYQERCKQEIEQKIMLLGGNKNQFQAILEVLEAENYWNESRFAALYARSKLSQKGWGKQLIKAKLLQKGIAPLLTTQALNSIEPQVYEHKIIGLINKLSEANYSYEAMVKYLLQKGYEWDLIKKNLGNHESY